MAPEGPISTVTGWPEVALADVTTKIGSGATPRGGAANYLDSRIGYALVRSQNVYDRSFDSEGLAFITDEQAQNLRGVVLERGDVLLNITGDGVTFGRACGVPEDVRPACVNQHVAIVRADPKQADPGYLLAFLTHPKVKGYIASFNAGGSRRAITKAHIESFRLPLPPLPEQRGIAATLGALDDKIELNRSTVDTIQDLSRTIFRRWRESHEATIESSFGDFANVFGGATPSTSVPDYWDGEIAWATPTDVTALAAPYLFRTSRGISEAGLNGISAPLHPVGTIFMTSRATIGAFAVAHVPATTNQGFIVVGPRLPEHRWFLFEEMRARLDEFRANANGSTFLELSRGRFKSLRLSVPGEHALRELDRVLSPLHEKAANAVTESASIVMLRDTLLPELLSGRIRVPAAQEAIAEVSA